MKPRHHVSRRAIELIKRFEGYRAKAAVLADGRWTIGYGHVKTAREGAEVSEDDAEALLIYDLMAITRAVNDWTFTPLTENQFDALVCFAFNVGLESFRGSSVLRRVNEGELLKAAYALEMWRKADFEGDRIVVDALVRRRAAEKALFLTPANGWIPAPSAVLQPQLDYDANPPPQNPVHLTVPLNGAEARAELADQPDTFPKEDVFPAAVAAEAVAARLQALVAEAPDVPAPVVSSDVPDVADHQPDPATDSAGTLPAAPTDDGATSVEELGVAEVVEPELSRAEPRRPQENAAVSPLKMFRDHVSFQPIDARPTHPAGAEQAGVRKLFGLGAAGFVCLVFAIAWSLFAAPGDGVFNSSFVSTVAGLVGIGCVVAAVYKLLVRLGGAEE